MDNFALENRLRNIKSPLKKEKIKKRYEQYQMYKDLKGDALAPIYAGLLVPFAWAGIMGISSIMSSFSGGDSFPLKAYSAGLIGLPASGVFAMAYGAEKIMYLKLKKQNEKNK